MWFENIDVAVESEKKINRCANVIHKCSKSEVMRYMFVRKSKKVNSDQLI